MQHDVSARKASPILHRNKTTGWRMETTHGSGDRAVDARRVGTYATAALALQIIAVVVWVFRYYRLHDRSAPMVGSDFAVFWAAARVALEHGPTAIFSPQWIQPIEAALRPSGEFAPWPYPPTFLLVVIPFGLVSFARAIVAFGVLSIACYAAVVVRLARPLDAQRQLAIAAFPGLIGAVLTMQNAFLTVAAAGAALLLLRSRPIAAGACIALLMMKPQYGVLFPLALICGRHWKALVSAGMFSVAFVAASVAAFGADAWRAFISFLPTFNRGVVEYGETFWRGMPSLFAMVRAAGAPLPLAYGVHASVAVMAVAAFAYVWIRGARFELRAAALAAATLLVQPYYMYYDLLWLVLPVIFLLLDCRNIRPDRLDIAVIALAWIAPAQAFIAVITGTMWPVSSVILVAVLAVIVRRTADSMPAGAMRAAASR
ncbi:glycosyltransferase family 87 protein [Burkholderia sp. JKS000303]|uniref:glycosyltransferase family 87 protein n=1 Tax=Burkholderia sp. JKS000303 TaxID=1938747 RepID=UPI00211D1839|nr:glycosyltransferase family 87 protein [Burkholderia sp. JKS000303]